MEETTQTYAWYAVKVFYNKVFEIEEMMAARGVESYIPTTKAEVKGEKYLQFKRKMALHPGEPLDPRYVFEEPQLYQRVPVIKSLMFIRCPRADIKVIRDAIGDLGFIYKTADWSHYAVIPDREMEIFKLVASSGENGLTYYSSEDYTRYKTGAKVRVITGPLKGAEGYIKRIKKDRRLLVAIQGIVAVATSYIPPSDLEIIPEEEASE